MSTERTQIPQTRDNQDVTGIAAWRILEPYNATLNQTTRDHIRYMMKEALKDYPELTGKTINIGAIPEGEFAYARAFIKNHIICLPEYEPDHRPYWDLLYHELAHIAIEIQYQQGEDVPHTSEEYCSLLSTSRIPTERLEWDEIDYLGEPTIPKHKWSTVAKKALAYRENHRDYIKQAKDWFGIAED